MFYGKNARTSVQIKHSQPNALIRKHFNLKYVGISLSTLI